MAIIIIIIIIIIIYNNNNNNNRLCRLCTKSQNVLWFSKYDLASTPCFKLLFLHLYLLFYILCILCTDYVLE